MHMTAALFCLASPLRPALAGLALGLLTAACTSSIPEGGDIAGIDTGTLQLVGKNRWAARQRSTAGRSIQAVEYHNGQIYVGFGDWRANTGPVAVTSWDPALADWVLHYSAGTEAIERYRTLGESLLVPYTDPEQAADYAQGPPWRQARATPATRESFYHVFDAVGTRTDRFLIGTRHNTGEALVMQLQDDGTWAETLLLAGRSDWFWYGAVLNDMLVVQSEQQGSFRYSNGQWEPVPALFSNPRMRSVVSTGNRVAGISRDLEPRRFRSELARAGHLHVSNGTELMKDTDATALDLNTDQATGWVYLLRNDRIERSRDLLEWETLALPVPPGATALDVAEGNIWVGTADSSLWMLKLQVEDLASSMLPGD